MHRSYSILILLAIFFSCNKKESLFEYVPASQSGIDFQNTITETDDINIIDFQYCYNGGGVGIGDFNNDSLPDIIFTGNQVSSKLYLNKGNLQFQDISKTAGFATVTWITGVSIVDINADGWDDIYLNVGGADCDNNCPNLLYINQGTDDNGIPTFLEMAKAYQLDDGYYAQQSIFFDYDLDGDLDAYVARNGNLKFDKNSPVPKRYFPAHLSDRLLRNDQTTGADHPVFTDVSEQAGISAKGFSLGLGIHDFNQDGRPDIYVANDFITNDLLWINGVDSSNVVHFADYASEVLSHQSYNAMGVDITDVNGDAEADIMVLDMLPANYGRQKRMFGSMNYEKFNIGLKNGYTPQYVRNTLQLSNGRLRGEMLNFSDAAFQLQVAKTDWSWAPLMADYDLDGDNDIFITNGYGKDITNLDFVNYTLQNNAFGNDQTRRDAIKKSISSLREVKLQNFFFENEAHSSFRDASTAWVPSAKSLSNGAAYADLDLDGDLDLVVNNIDQAAFVMENKSGDQPGNYYLKIKLRGQDQNKQAIGSKITIWQDGRKQVRYHSVVRGYLSSVEPVAIFGLSGAVIDSVHVIWPTGSTTTIQNPQSNTTLYIEEKLSRKPSVISDKTAKTLLKNRKQFLAFKHQENISNDYVHQKLLLNQHSKSGPCMVATRLEDIEGDVIFIGGSYRHPGTLWKQDENGDYSVYQKLDSLFEDSDALFFDFDGDGKKDLYVASGGSEWSDGSREYEDRLYRNDGTGIFKRTKAVLPVDQSSSSCIRHADFDQDGDMDLFIGSSIVPRKYPSTPEHRLLINENGAFKEANTNPMGNLGMVKDALWTDIDGNGWEDLIVVGDWMPITIFYNEGGTLSKAVPKFIDEQNKTVKTNGWWRSIDQGDFDNDGDVDFVVGNQGTNNFITPIQEYPIYVYKGDFDQNGSIDPLQGAYFNTGEEMELMPLHSRDDVMGQLVSLKSRFKSYEDFSKARFTELLNIENLEDETLQANLSASVLLKNMGNNVFQAVQLPVPCQMAPINDFLVKDLDEDGYLDVLLVGNELSAEVHYGGYDAFHGALLLGSKEGKFQYVKTSESGFFAPGHVSRIVGIEDRFEKKFIVASVNSDSTLVFENN